MKVIPLFLILFNLVFGSFSEGTYAAQDRAYLQDLNCEFMRCASVFQNQSTPEQIEEARANIEQLAISGDFLSFKLLWDLRKGNFVEAENKAKAEFVRDFLVNDLHPIAITHVSNKIIEYQNASPSFLTILQELINLDPEREIINRNFQPILNLIEKS